MTHCGLRIEVRGQPPAWRACGPERGQRSGCIAYKNSILKSEIEGGLRIAESSIKRRPTPFRMWAF